MSLRGGGHAADVAISALRPGALLSLLLPGSQIVAFVNHIALGGSIPGAVGSLDHLSALVVVLSVVAVTHDLTPPSALV